MSSLCLCREGLAIVQKTMPYQKKNLYVDNCLESRLRLQKDHHNPFSESWTPSDENSWIRAWFLFAAGNDKVTDAARNKIFKNNKIVNQLCVPNPHVWEQELHSDHGESRQSTSHGISHDISSGSVTDPRIWKWHTKLSYCSTEEKL